MRRTIHPRSAFTLIELLIVIVLLGIVAAISIPQFTSSSASARASALASTLQSVKGQVDLYKLQHGDQLPDLTAASALGEHFRPLAERSTYGNPPKSYGPYLSSVPVNAMTGGSTVMNATSFGADGRPAAVPGADFIYDYGGGSGTGKLWGTADRATGALASL